jgi:apolipoprotein N-acyltransferase
MLGRRQFVELAISFIAGCLAATGFNGGLHILVGMLGLLGFGYIISKWQSAARLSFGFGLGYFLMLLAWIRVVGEDAWVGLALLMAGFWTAAGYLISRLRSRNALAIATIFTSFELIRDRFPWGGFGWGQFGIWLVEIPIFKNLVPLVGQTFATFLVAYLALEFWINRKRFLAVLAGLSIAGVLFPLFPLSQLEVPAIKIAAVQGGVVNYGLGTSGPAGVVLDKHLEVSYQNRSELSTTDLVIWPESAVDSRLDSAVFSKLFKLEADLGVPLLFNSVVELDPTTVSNQTQLVSNGKIDFIYAKQRLVPFGEFLPLRTYLSKYTDRVNLMPRDFAPGETTSPVNFDLPVVICFEIADDQIAAIQPAGQLLIVQTNNATYQNTNQTEQQLLITRFRALELQTPTLTVSTSGVSAVINRQGETLQRIEPGERGVLIYETDGVVFNTPAKLFSQFAPWLIWIAAGLALLRSIRVRL